MTISIIIVILLAYQANSYTGISLLNDEFGYWSTAAYLNRLNWNELVGMTPYYAPGYGFVLAVIMKICPTTVLAYKVAIGLNIFLLWLSYYFLEKLGRLLFPNLSDNLLIIIGCLSVLVPNLLVYSQYTWPEPFINFLYIYMTYSLAIFAKNKNVRILNGGLIAACLLSFLHPRGQFVLIVYLGIILAYSLYIKKYGVVCLTIFTFGFAMICTSFLKNWALHSIWPETSEYSAVNSVSFDSTSIYDQIKALFVEPNLFLISIMGKVESSLLMSGFMVILPFASLIHTMKRKNRANSTNTIWTLVSIWLILGFIVMLGLTSARTLFWMERQDNLVYTRYFDFTVIPLTFMGWGLLKMLPKNKYLYLIVGISLSLISFPYLVSKIYEIPTGFNYICSVMFGSLMLLNISSQQLIWGVEIVQLIFLVLLILVYVKEREKLAFYVLVIMSFLLNSYAYYAVNQKIINNRLNDYSRIADIADYIEGNRIKKITYILDSEIESYPYDAKLIQFLDPSLQVSIIDEYDENSEENASTVFMLNSRSDKNNQIQDLYDHKIETDGLSLYNTK